MANKSKNKNFSINIIHDNECDVYVGTSENIPGLILETSTLGELLDAAREVVPQLLEYNLKISRDNTEEVTINMYLLRSQPPPQVSDHCRYTFEQEAAIA